MVCRERHLGKAMFKRLIPSILIKDKRLVKGVRYRHFKDAGGPATTARAHNHQGADELIVCDIEASRHGQAPDFETLKAVAEECFMPLTIFAGIQSLERAETCMSIGADKIGLTSAAYDKPDLINDLARQYGSQAIVLGLDITLDDAGKYVLYDHRKDAADKNMDPFEFAQEMVKRGCGEIRVMAVHREGSLAGFDLDMYEKLKAVTNVPIILEGGAGSLEDIENAYKKGVDAIATGAMLVFSDANLVKIQQHMRSRSINMRY